MMIMNTISRSLSLLLLGLLLVLAGCSFLDPLSAELGNVIERYCDEPQDVRDAIGDDVNAHAAPHVVDVRCAGDPDS